MISVLFVNRSSVYHSLGVDCWDIYRDARLFSGTWPVICHPPCRLWSRMRHFSSAPESEKDLALLAVKLVRANGGVLEHPVGSKLFGYLLPLPGKIDEYGGYTIKFDQHSFGFSCRKWSYLYIVGVPINKLKPMPMNYDAITHVIGSSSKKRDNLYRLPELPKKNRSDTVIDLALWLVDLAAMCHVSP